METRLSAFIRQHREEIVSSWATKVRDQILRAPLGREQLLDALHLFLDDVIEALEHRSRTLPENGRCEVAREHGRQRHTLRLRISELVREYGLLFESILERTCQNGTTLGPVDVLELSRCLYAGAAEAVDEFAQRSHDERRHADFESFAFVAHEIRNPLSTAKLTWESLRTRPQMQGATAERHGRSLDRLCELITSTLTQSRLTAMASGGTPLRCERLSLAQLLRDAAEEIAVQAAEKRIDVKIDVPADASAQVDPRLLRSAVGNLAHNAVKFTQSGRAIVLFGRACSEGIRIEVRDGCGGLALQEAEALFDSFTQAGPERSGFGLGLAIVRQAVQAHGGTVSVRNEPGCGCAFTIEIPCRPTACTGIEPD